MSELNLRRLRYFLAVADTLNFGRAAERLHIAEPVLSRQIALLESELGVTLFVRSSRGTSLTDAGRLVQEDAASLLQSADALRKRARSAALGVDRLALGFMPGLMVTPIVQGLRQSFPGIELQLVRTGWDDQVDTILDGRVDLGLVRLPVPERGLQVEPLFAENRVAVLSTAHPLAAAATLNIAALAESELLQSPDAAPEWREARRRLDLPVAMNSDHPRDVEIKLERVAASSGVVFLPASTARFYTRPDVVVRAVAGLEPSRVAVARRTGHSSRVLLEAVALAHALRASLTTERVLDEDGPRGSR
ncbi:LysR family transcriptional regulator [Streptomyces parvulus]|uniref:LysR family transcriptional regulator n=1 Tax=Streptomyces parvulus TaxID=146923 RepID=UPI001CF965D5|nr:LysR substrate-binding domain-containing protein [Streptomyces parvulus]